MLGFISSYPLESGIIICSLCLVAGACFFAAFLISDRKAKKLKKYTQEVHHHLEAILSKSHDLKKEVNKDIKTYSEYTQKGEEEINRLEDLLEDKNLQIEGITNELNLLKAKLSNNNQDKITNLELRIFELETENRELVGIIDVIRESFSEPLSQDSNEAEVVELEEVRENKKEQKDLFEVFKKMLG